MVEVTTSNNREATTSSSKVATISSSKVATISSSKAVMAVTSSNKARAGRRRPRVRERMPSSTKGSVCLPLILPWFSFKLLGWIHITCGLLGGLIVHYLYHSIPYSLTGNPLRLVSIHTILRSTYFHCWRTTLTLCASPRRCPRENGR